MFDANGEDFVADHGVYSPWLIIVNHLPSEGVLYVYILFFFCKPAPNKAK